MNKQNEKFTKMFYYFIPSNTFQNLFCDLMKCLLGIQNVLIIHTLFSPNNVASCDMLSKGLFTFFCALKNKDFCIYLSKSIENGFL